MAEKPTLYIDSQTGKILGPSEVIGHLFANPKMKSWYGPPESMLVISDPQRFQKTLERLRQLGYPLVEKSSPEPPAAPASRPETATGS
jgi:hypothetical protein